MKFTVRLSDADVGVLDHYVGRAGMASRSDVIHHAIRLLRHPDLEQQYAAAWAEWDAVGDGELWARAAADGISGAPR